MNKSELLPLEKKVAQAVEENFSEQANICFVLGVSGGIDSTCLLHIFSKLQIKIIAVHINYKTRGEASGKDAEFVSQICKTLNVEHHIIEADYNKASYSNFQDWARTVRYDYFKEVANQTNANGIAVAHNEDDQIETILQKILRGGGLASWSAMRVWNRSLFRPLLKASREEIRAYCENQDITYRTDRSNFDNKYARNFLRNEWLPQLRQHFPGWRSNIQQVAEQADVFKSALHYILDDILRDEIGLQRKSFLALSLPLQKSLLLHVIKIKWPDASLSKDALAELSKLNTLQTGKKIQLSANLFLVRNRQFFELQEADNHPKKSYLIAFDKVKTGIKVGHLTLTLKPFDNPNFSNALYLDAQKLRWPLRLRRWVEGDQFQPLGMNGHQTVANHLTNRKVNAAKKNEALVIEDFEETITAVIFPPIKTDEPGTISELFKCTASTRNVLMIKPDA